jgi:hypothetical protein
MPTITKRSTIGYRWEKKGGGYGFGRLPEGRGRTEQWLCDPVGVPLKLIATRGEKSRPWVAVEGLTEDELSKVSYVK